MADITVIGGINIDIEGAPFEKLVYGDSNPGRVSMAFGGVGRNITENIARMGGSIAMLSVTGDDNMGLGAREHLQKLGVDVSMIGSLSGRTSAIYLSILNSEKDMELAICDMDIISHITPELIRKYSDIIRRSKVLALDGNLSEEALCYATEEFSDMLVFLDPVSAAKAPKAGKIAGRFTCIKPNIMEAEILSGMEIKDESDLKKAAGRLMDMGVEKLFVTLNRDGVYYRDSAGEGFIRPKKADIVSATGAGDSFSAAIIMGMVEGMDTKDIAAYGMAASAITMESSSAVNQNISREEIERRLAYV